jgi:hypothetical protein
MGGARSTHKTGEKCNKVLVRKLGEQRLLKRPRHGWKKILKWNLNKYAVRVRNGFMWFRIIFSDGRL